MDVKRATGLRASVIKYDVLTALGLWGMNLESRRQISALRLITMITARYNWSKDELSIGQRDMARVCNVTERTIKREIKLWTDQQILLCKRNGVRGRVGAYRLNVSQIYRLTMDHWSLIGHDYADRLATYLPQAETKVVSVDFKTATPLQRPQNKAERVLAHIESHEPDTYRAWFMQIKIQDDDPSQVHITTISKFAARYIEMHHMPLLTEAVSSVYGHRQIVLSYPL